ncbi:12074_t:CDS:2 [Funneliformis geosporum]|uniref:12074_t:CDS:1 n=1 Tax=Funneliformis geosporum TaxID=1117311 RepID=A0A9W4WWH4_9GLOM|nr:12074_t:CDS:2 [Funneliformis geosporum]
MNLELRSPFESDYPAKLEATVRDGPVRCISFNKRGTMLAGGCSDGYCIIWDFQSMSIIRKMRCHVSSVTSVSWSRNGRCILSSGEDHKCVYWDITKGTQKWIRFDGPVLMSQMHPRNNFIFVASIYQDSPVIVEIGDTIRRFPLPTNAEPLSDVNNSSITLLEETYLLLMLGNNTPLYSKTVVCRYDKRGNRILTGTNKGYLNVIDPNTRRILDNPKLSHLSIRNISVSRNGKAVAVNISDKTIRLYGLDDEGMDIKSELQFAETVNKDNWNQCCFSQNGDYLIGGSGKLAAHEIFIWDRRTTRLVQVLQGPNETCIDLAQHPIQPIIISVDVEGTMYTWTTRHKEDWVCWDPAFKEIDDNIVYEEREDEFDIMSEEETEYSRNNQVKQEDNDDEEIDVVTVDRPARSDSSDIEDDELIYLVDSEVESYISTKTLETQQPESSTRSGHSANNIVVSSSTTNTSIGLKSKVKGKNKARIGKEYEDVNGWKKKSYHN